MNKKEEDQKEKDSKTLIKYYESGNKKSKVEILNDKYNGKYIDYYDNDQENTQGNYKDGLKDGVWRSYYRNGNLQKTGIYESDKKDGKWRFYNKESKLVLEEHYKKGLLEGESISYKKGLISSRGDYHNNLKQGKWFYYKNGNLEVKYDYKSGVLNGEITSYHKNGKIRSKEYYVSGNKEGELLIYNDKEILLERQNYKKNNLDGEFSSYYSDGNFKVKGFFKNSKRVGIWKTFFKNGELSFEKNYDELGLLRKKIAVIDRDDENFMEDLKELTNSKKIACLEELYIGNWEEENGEVFASKIVKYLIKYSGKFLNLKKIFFADIKAEESEISWIKLCDMAELIMAFPNLKSFKIKGSKGLRFENLKHNNLEEFILINGGLGKDCIKDISLAKLPKLKHLELYLGQINYGFNGDIEDLEAFMKKDLFPNLKYLGLKNSEIQNEIAEKIVDSEILEQIETLDLSMGCMTDKGLDFLLNSKKLKNIKLLNIDDNFLTNKKVSQVKNLEIEVINEEQKEYNKDYYTSISK